MSTEPRTVIRADRPAPVVSTATSGSEQRSVSHASARCEPSLYVMARSCATFRRVVVRSGASGLSDRRRELASRWAAGGSEGSAPRGANTTVRGGGS